MISETQLHAFFYSIFAGSEELAIDDFLQQ